MGWGSVVTQSKKKVTVKNTKSKSAVSGKAPAGKSAALKTAVKKPTMSKKAASKKVSAKPVTAAASKKVPSKSSVSKKSPVKKAVADKRSNEGAKVKQSVAPSPVKKTKENNKIIKNRAIKVGEVVAESSAMNQAISTKKVQESEPKSVSAGLPTVKPRKKEAGMANSSGHGLAKQSLKKRGWRDIEALTERARLKSLLSDIWHEDIDLDSDIFGETDHLSGYYTDKEEEVEVEVEKDEEWEEFEEDEG